MTLPCGFRIGHTDKSETQYPAAYTPPGKEYAFIDNPGFKDNRGIEVEIVNGFFREQVTKQTDELKFLLLITHQDLNLRGEQFRDSIRAFSDFLGIFDDDDTKNLSKSIAIIVTRVEQDDETDDEMIDILQGQLNAILKSMKKSASFQNKNEEFVFNEIVDRKQIGIFSNPRKKMTLDDRQSKRIHELITNLSYVRTSDVRVRVRIEQSFVPRLLVYTEKLYRLFQEEFEIEMKKTLHDFFNREKEEIKNIQNATNVVKVLNQVFDFGAEINNYELFINKLRAAQVIGDEAKLKFVQLKDLLSFLVQILPEENRKSFALERKWLSEGLNQEIKVLVNELVNTAQDELNELVRLFEKNTKKSIEGYFINSIESKSDVEKMRQVLIGFRDKALLEADLESLLDNELFEEKVKKSLIEKHSDLKGFIEALDNEKKKEFAIRRSWLSFSLSNTITTLGDFCSKFSIEKSQSFEEFIEKLLAKRIAQFFAREIDAAKYVDDLHELESALKEFEAKAAKEKAFNKFLNDTDARIVIESEKKQYGYIDKLLSKKRHSY